MIEICLYLYGYFCYNKKNSGRQDCFLDRPQEEK